MVSQAYESSLLALAHELESCRTIGGVGKIAAAFVAAFGFDYIAHLKLPALTAARAPRPDVTFSTFPAPWLGERDSEALAATDPVLLEARRRAGCFTWQSAWQLWRHLPGAGARIASAAGLGITDGYAAPMPANGVDVPLVILAGAEPRLDGRAASALTLACTAIHRRICWLDCPRIHPNATLTARERQCLSWAAAGKSDWEIGQITELSAKTVNYHIENAKRKWGVQTRVQAIVEALRSGVIA